MSEKITSSLAQGISLPVEGEKYNSPGSIDIIRRAGTESMVLMKNEDHVLPIGKEKVALFGRCQVNTFFTGYGSGGDVKPTRKVSILEGIKASGMAIDKEVADSYEAWCSLHEPDMGSWGNWPSSLPEMPVSDEFVKNAAARNEKAILIIGRSEGEDQDNTLTKGSFYLSDEEENLLSKINRYFEKVIVLLNIGGIMDFSWIGKFDHLKGLMIVWQLGQEMGHAVAEVLSGSVSPSGHLAQSVAKTYEEYPSAPYFGNADKNEYKEGIHVGYRGIKHPLFPFGYGLSYTTFKNEVTGFTEKNNGYEIGVKITNTGEYAGKGLAQIYLSIPGYDFLSLSAFEKSDKLFPGESETFTLFVRKEQLSVFEKERECFVIQEGKYEFFLGDSPYDTSDKAGESVFEEEEILVKCDSITEDSKALRKRIEERLPKEIKSNVTEEISFGDVLSGKYSIDDFIAQMTPEELSDLARGEGSMESPLAIKGNTGVFGGITPSLRSKGIPVINTSDGPSGLRVSRYCSLLPIGSAIACTWNRHLTEELYRSEADDMKHYGVDVLLGPGINIQRNPLCGRNFEYYSEDPYLAGMMAGAAVRGIQSQGSAACIKHFACNNQEKNRSHNSSNVDEKTLREIYLRPFYIAIRESSPWCIMTSYNKINGIWSHYNYDLVTTVLRKEWGYRGLVMTDWWMELSQSPEFPEIRDNAYRIRSGINLLMPGELIRGDGHFEHDANPETYLTLGELQENARHILYFILRMRQRYGQDTFYR